RYQDSQQARHTAETRYGKEQQRRQSRAVGAKIGLETATRDIEHLLFAALRVLNDDTEDGTTEETRKWVVTTLLEYAQGACENLKEREEARYEVTALYLYPTHPGPQEPEETDATE